MKKNLLTISTVLSLILFAGSGGTNTQTKAPENINDVINTAAIATFDKFSINRNVAYDGQLTATDADTLKYIIVTQPQHGTVVIHDNGCFTYTPNTGYQGSDTFSYKASDDVSSCSVKTVTVDVCEPQLNCQQLQQI